MDLLKSGMGAGKVLSSFEKGVRLMTEVEPCQRSHYHEMRGTQTFWKGE